MSEQTLSLPSLLIFAGISFFLYRYFFSGAGTGSSAGRPARGGRRVDPAAVEQVAAMFPQLDRRTIAWNLQRNGGNVNAAIERMLTTGRLEPPPPSYQPEGPIMAAAATPAVPSSRSSGAAATKASTHPDLIARYNLASRLSEGEQPEEDSPAAQAAAAKGKARANGWSANRDERADMIRKRKEQMILQARRKMEEKDRKDVKGKAAEKV